MSRLAGILALFGLAACQSSAYRDHHSADLPIAARKIAQRDLHCRVVLRTVEQPWDLEGLRWKTCGGAEHCFARWPVLFDVAKEIAVQRAEVLYRSSRYGTVETAPAVAVEGGGAGFQRYLATLDHNTLAAEEVDSAIERSSQPTWRIELVPLVRTASGNFYDANRIPDQLAYVLDVSNEWAVADDAKVCFRADDDWNFEIADPEREGGFYTRAVLDRQGNVHIAHQVRGSKDRLKIVRKTDSGWTNTVVDEGDRVGVGLAFAVDSKGREHVAYLRGSSEVAYASAGHVEVVAHGKFRDQRLGLVLDHEERPVIAFRDETSLRLATQAGERFRVEPVAEHLEAGQNALLATDKSGAIHLVYDEAAKRRLSYGVRSQGGQFKFEVVPTPDAFFAYDFGVDSAGTPHVILETRLKTIHLRRVNGAWVSDAAGVRGTFPSLAVGPHDRNGVALFEVETGRLSVSRQDGDAWATQVVDARGETGFYPALVIDESGKARLAYRDGKSGQLLFGSAR